MNIYRKLKLTIAILIRKWVLRKKIKFIHNCKTEKKRIILTHVPSHGNLGDQLIALSTKKWLNENFHNFEIITFTTGELEIGIDSILNTIRESDIILISGGGFMGDLWPAEEERIQKIVKQAKLNKIVILPQTIYYNDLNSSLLKRAQNIYSNHVNLTIFCREIQSYNFARIHFARNSVKISPDMGLYSIYKEEYNREGILFCLRKDKEKISNNDEIISELINLSKGQVISFIDTVLSKAIDEKESINEISIFTKQIQKSKLVITDRLHGMIYAVITGTPVIALNNISNKIKCVYEAWLAENMNVKYCETASQAIEAYHNLLGNEPTAICYKDKFKILTEELSSNN